MDIMLTDFENAAMTVVTGMLVNLINDFDLDFIMPISLVDENMHRAHLKNAVQEQKFWFKTTIFPEGPTANYKSTKLPAYDYLRSQNENPGRLSKPEDFKELYIWQLLAGDATCGFSKGLIELSTEWMTKRDWS